MWTVNFQMFKLVLEKAEEPEIKLPTPAGSWKKQESSRKTCISALLTMPKPLTVWITINCGKFFKKWEYQTTWPASWETYMQVSPSPTRWTWVWVNSGIWWWTGRPGMLWFMGSQRVGHDWVTEVNWTETVFSTSVIIFFSSVWFFFMFSNSLLKFLLCLSILLLSLLRIFIIITLNHLSGRFPNSHFVYPFFWVCWESLWSLPWTIYQVDCLPLFWLVHFLRFSSGTHSSISSFF